MINFIVFDLFVKDPLKREFYNDNIQFSIANIENSLTKYWCMEKLNTIFLIKFSSFIDIWGYFENPPS